MTARTWRGVSRAGVAALLLATACAPEWPVERAYDGYVVEGRYIEPAAYAAFLRGAMAEASGNPKAALLAYMQALRLDPASPETWSRIASARCAIDPRDPQARAAAERAVALDPEHGPRWATLARCGHTPAEAATSAPDREGAISTALAAADQASSWNAVLAWARGRDDLALEAFALGKVAALDPSRRDAVAAGAEELAGLGAVVAARRVAAEAVDAVAAPMSAPRAALAGRLAIDEAIARGDAAATRARTTRTGTGLGEAAARALLQDQVALAVDLANERSRAEPDDLAPRIVLASAGKGASGHAGALDLFGAVAAIRAARVHLPAAVWVTFGLASSRWLGAPETRRALDGVDRDAIVPGDDGVSRAAVALALRGVIDSRDLSPDGVTEFTAIRGSPFTETSPPPNADALDLRHRYLLAALTSPRSKTVDDLGARLGRLAPSDRVVMAALATARLGADAALAPDAAATLFARDPGDPLLVAVALRLALKLGDAVTTEAARSALLLLAPGR